MNIIFFKWWVKGNKGQMAPASPDPSTSDDTTGEPLDIDMYTFILKNKSQLANPHTLMVVVTNGEGPRKCSPGRTVGNQHTTGRTGT
jgi:hypothetical protein